MRKQILILTTTRDFLGKFETGNVRILKRMGYTVHYAANMSEQDDLYDREEIEKLGIESHHIDIERSPFMIRNNRKAFLQLIELVRKYGISLIHCHTPVGGLLGRLAGRYFGKDRLKVIYTAHGFHFYKGAPWLNNSIYYQVERFLARYTDILVVINSEDYASAGKFRLRKGGAVYRIPGVGLDTERFHIFSEEEKKRGREALDIGAETLFLLSVGEINENKNHEIILRALALMKRRGQDISGIQYVICGDGFFRGRREKQIQSMGLDENVKIYGYRKDIPDILGCANALVFPSKREGLGMAALESLAMGIPVIAADNRGTREYMKDGVNGYICKSGDVEDYIRGIQNIRDMDVEKRRKMQIKCRETVERFDRAYVDEIMGEVYRIADRMVEHCG